MVTAGKTKNFFIYIMTNHTGTLYTGMTNDLLRRVYEHKQGLVEGFTQKYNLKRLVFFEDTPSVESALAREKEIKGWRRIKKVALIEIENPGWRDLSADWYQK